MLASISGVFRQVTQCFMVVLVTIGACYLFFKGGKWCDKTLGKVWGKKPCDQTKRAVFAALAACTGLMLLGYMTGGGYSGGYSGGGYSGGSF